MFKNKSGSKIDFSNDFSFRNILELFFIILAVVLFLRLFVMDISRISSESMEPNLYKNDVVLISKLSYFIGIPNYIPIINSIINFDMKLWYKEPKINDIIVFSEYDSTNTKLLVKRIAAIPNDSVLFDINTKLIRLNNDYPFEYEVKCKIPKMNEEISLDNFNKDFYLPYIKNEIENISDTITSYKFQNNYYFVLGDNFNNSNDSRDFGLISGNSIIGKTNFILLSPSKNIFFKFIE